MEYALQGHVEFGRRSNSTINTYVLLIRGDMQRQQAKQEVSMGGKV